MNLLFLGASNTDCGHCFTPDNLGNGYVKKTCSLLSRMLPAKDGAGLLPDRTDADRSMLHAVNGGTDGFTFPRIYQKWKAAWSGIPFDAVSILGGINEVGALTDSGLTLEAQDKYLQDSAQALGELLAKLTASGCPRIIVLEPFLFDTPAYLQCWSGCLSKVRAMIRRTIAAQESSVFFLRTQPLLDDAAARLGVRAISPDGIHLTDTGHECLAAHLAALLADILS